tara:strand:- start:405 stop:2720 length:2316 start_codon:yes stop_codon:yes gene_type:complete
MSTIKINELATSAISLTDFFVKANSAGLANKNTMQEMSNFLGTIGSLGLRGVLLSNAALVELDGIYVAGDSGTYTNNGGLIINVSNQIVLITITGNKTVFAKAEIPITLTIDPTVIDGSSNAVSGNAVFDENIKTIYNSNANVNQKVFADVATQSGIKDFILDFKSLHGFEVAKQYYIKSILRVSSDTLNPDYYTIRFDVRDTSGSRVAYNTVSQKDENDVIKTGVESFNLNTGVLEMQIVVNWSNIVLFTAPNSDATLLNNEDLYKDSFQQLLFSRNSEVEFKNVFENYNFQLSAPDYGTPTEPTGFNITYAQNDGITFDIVNYTSGRGGVKFDKNFAFKPKDYLAIQVSYRVNSENMTFGGGLPSSVGGNNSAGFELTMLRQGVGATAKFGGLFVTGKTRTETALVKIPDSAQFSGEYRLDILSVMTALSNIGVDLSFTIEEIAIFNLGNEDVDKDKELFESLTPQNLDNFLPLLNTKNPFNPKKVTPYALLANKLSGWYSDKVMFVYSASVWETLIQGKYISERTGMVFDETIARDGKDGFVSTTKGGSQLTPVITGAASKETGDSHYAKVINTWNHYQLTYGKKSRNVVFLPFGYNHPGVNSAGVMKPFIAGGTAIEDATFGLDRSNHPPYTVTTSFEFDLASDSTIPMRTYNASGVATNNGVPSYGSCLRGVVEFILEKDPSCEIFIPTIYFNVEEDSIYRASFDALIAVNIEVAKEYGFSAPRVDLRAGVNSKSKLRLLKDAIHPNFLVGTRSAMACLAEMGVSV